MYDSLLSMHCHCHYIQRACCHDDGEICQEAAAMTRGGDGVDGDSGSHDDDDDDDEEYCESTSPARASVPSPHSAANMRRLASGPWGQRTVRTLATCGACSVANSRATHTLAAALFDFYIVICLHRIVICGASHTFFMSGCHLKLKVVP